MNNFTKTVLFINIVLMVFAIGSIDYEDLSWVNNSGSYIAFLCVFFNALSLIFSYRYEKNREK